jgi:serine/threonine protein kinase
MSLINNKYIILEEIGEGSFGKIYKGKNIRTNELVAIKIEPIKNGTRLLKNESIIYQFLNNVSDIPNVKWYGKDKFNYYMVINLLGESLQNMKDTRTRFSLKLILQIGIQILVLLRTLHDKGLVHRDVKPDNFLLGLNDKRNQLNIIDFGFCKSYIHNDQHIPMKKTSNLIGSLSYASINAHNFIELSRRDDLESLGYILIYLYLGKLDWQTEESYLYESKNETIKNMKIKMIDDSRIPLIIIEYFKNVRTLEFEEKPKYAILIDMFRRELESLH